MLYFVNDIKVDKDHFQKLCLKDILIDKSFITSFKVMFKEDQAKMEDLAKEYFEEFIIKWLIEEVKEEVIGSNIYKIK